MKRRLRQLFPIWLVCSILIVATVLADGITVRIMPPNKAQFLQYQRFDFRVEATAADAAAAVSSLTVTLDGKDITSIGVTDSPTPNVRNWTYRGGYLGFTGLRAVSASATGAGISGSASNVITVREWTSRSQPLAVKPAGLAAVSPLEAGTDPEILNNLHLGAISPLMHKEAVAADQRRAKNVILLIGDGMGVAHRTAGHRLKLANLVGIVADNSLGLAVHLI